MFCSKCGNQLRDGAKFCNNCGEPVCEPLNDQDSENQTRSQITQNPQTDCHTPKHQISDQPVYQPQTKPKYSPGTHPYHRLGGFLMFVVVGSYISGVYSFISVISTIVSYSGILSMSNWLPGGFKGWVVFSMIGSSILSIVAGIICISYANQLRSKDSNVLHFIQSSAITMMIISTVFYSISLIWVKQYDLYGVIKSGSIIGILISMIISWIIGLVISSIYAGTSVRLRTYMGTDSYLKQSIFNKNSHPVPADGSDQPQYSYQDVNNNYMNNNVYKWHCSGCGNMISTDPCPYCGKSFDSAWICSKCGEVNSSIVSMCTTCGTNRFPKSKEANKSDWSCPNCLRVNPSYLTTCICGTPKSQGVQLAQPQTVVGDNEWLCPSCGKINANYVGTCGCGQVKE